MYTVMKCSIAGHATNVPHVPGISGHVLCDKVVCTKCTWQIAGHVLCGKVVCTPCTWHIWACSLWWSSPLTLPGLVYSPCLPMLSAPFSSSCDVDVFILNPFCSGDDGVSQPSLPNLIWWWWRFSTKPSKSGDDGVSMPSLLNLVMTAFLCQDFQIWRWWRFSAKP